MTRYHSTDEALCRWAVFYLLGRVLATLRPLLADLSLSGSLALVIYLTGLLTQQNITATAIATQVGLVSHDSLRRMLCRLGWSVSVGVVLSVRLIGALSTEPGWLILDDVLLPKPFAQAIALCFWDYDHALRRHGCGQRLVFVLWSNGRLVIPLLFAFWQKDPTRKPRRKKRTRRHQTKAPPRRRLRARKAKRVRRVRCASGVHYRTKNELARVLIWRLVRQGLPIEFLLFDNWYAAHDNFRLCERLHLKWVTRAKSNYKVNFGGQWLTVKQVAAKVAKANYHYYAALQARARSFVVERDGRSLKLTVIKDDRGPEGGRTKYLLTNATALETRQVIAWYRRRWAIEVFFRDCKQYLGLCQCEARQQAEMMAHVALVCVAYTLLQLVKPSEHERYTSVRATKHLLAPLVIVKPASGARRVERPLPNGSAEEVSIARLLVPLRTRLPALSLAENLVFT
jgi:hypothetical protein